EDDVRALALFRDAVAGTGGQVLIFVPAIQALYSQHDAALGHHRRYSKRSPRAPFAAARPPPAAGTKTKPTCPLGWTYKPYISGNTEHTSSKVRLFDRLVAPWALPIERLISPPIGLSLFAVGRARVPAA